MNARPVLISHPSITASDGLPPPTNPNSLFPRPHNSRLIARKRLQLVTGIDIRGAGAGRAGLRVLLAGSSRRGIVLFGEALVFEGSEVFGCYGYGGGFSAEHACCGQVGNCFVWRLEKGRGREELLN